MNSNDKDYPVKTFSNGVKGLVSTGVRDILKVTNEGKGSLLKLVYDSPISTCL